MVYYLEYRGTGLSYSSDIKAEEMTTEKYISDVVAVSKYLSERFGQEKIYIMGHSFGTYIAIKTVQRYPDYYHAYIAMSQTCNQTKSEYIAYDYTCSFELQYEYYEQIDAPIKEFWGQITLLMDTLLYFSILYLSNQLLFQGRYVFSLEYLYGQKPSKIVLFSYSRTEVFRHGVWERISECSQVNLHIRVVL